jgi:hypothetical protein
MRTTALILALGASALLTVGCASKEEPATRVISSAQAAIDETRPDAEKYAPEQLQAADASLATAKQDYANEKYQDVIDAAPKLNEQVIAMRDSVVATQTAMAAATHEWEELSEEVPKLVKAIEVRVGSLSGTKQQAAKVELETMKATWQEAAAAFSAGKPLEAADKARVVEVKAKEVSEQLGISPA